MRRLLLILSLALTLLPLHCQQTENTLILPEHAFGVTCGANLSFFNFKPVVSQARMPVGVNVGLQYRMILEKYFGLWFQLNYDQRGFMTTVEGVHHTRTFDYIELPIFAHFTFGRRMTRFHFDLGPTIGYMVRPSDPQDFDCPELSLPVAHRFDYGVSGMIGMEFNTAKAGIYLINLRYNSSFANIFTRDYDNFTLSTGQSIIISGGWMWRFRPKRGYQAYDLRVKKKKLQ